MQQPLIILDEAGDLDDRSILEIKRLYNNLEGSCGFYLVGADGLQRKIERGVANGKQGFLETYSRFGKKFSRHTPKDLEKRTPFMVQAAREILEAQGITSKEIQDTLIKPMLDEGLKDLRTVRREFIKMRIKEKQDNGVR